MNDEPVEATFNPTAALMGWLIPGAGHWKLGEKHRGRLILLGIGGLFLLGVLVGGIDCVDRSEDFVWFIAQMGAGGLALATDALNTLLLKSARVGELLPLATQNGTIMVSSYKGAGPSNEMGMLMCGLAGMMNVIAVLDVSFRSSRSIGTGSTR